MDGDPVEALPAWHVAGAVGDDDLDVVDAERVETLAGEAGERRQALDAEHRRAEPAEDRGRVARPGADLEHVLAALERERLADRRDHPRLRDRLLFLDRQRPVLVGVLANRPGDEALARHRGHRREHALVGDPAVAQLLGDHRCAAFGEIVH